MVATAHRAPDVAIAQFDPSSVVGPMTAALLACGPSDDGVGASDAFGRFIGEWDVDVRWYAPDGTLARRLPGDWTFAWALDGRAVIDVWRVPSKACEAADPSLLPVECGLSVRFYDPELGAWRSTWHGPMAHLVAPFVARATDDQIVLERQDGGSSIRWMFSDIGSRSFYWSNMVSEDGAGWRLVQDMRAARRS